MQPYNKIILRENKKRIESLKDFQKLVDSYFDNLVPGFLSGLVDNETAAQIRPQIAVMINRIHKIIRAAGVTPIINYSPAPVTRQPTHSVDLILNIFNLPQLQLGKKEVLDFVYISIGIYTDDQKAALIRQYNPFYYLNLLVDYLISIPFRVLGQIGFDSEKIQSSTIGKIIKNCLSLLTYTSAFLTIAEKLGFLQTVKDTLNRIFN